MTSLVIMRDSDKINEDINHENEMNVTTLAEITEIILKKFEHQHIN